MIPWLPISELPDALKDGREVLYTIGHRESYQRYFREQGQPSKLGRCSHTQWRGEDGYPGGSVYLTLEEAQAACPDGYAPYGLATTIENTYLVGSSRHLIASAPLVRLAEINPPIAEKR